MKKGKKKKLDGIPEVVATVKKESVPALQKAAIGTAGTLIATFGASKIPDLEIAKKIPGVGDYVAKTLPGLAVIGASIGVAMFSKDENVQAGAIGVSIAGAIDILRRNGILTKIQTFMPTPGINGFNARDLGFIPRGIPDMDGIAQSLQSPNADPSGESTSRLLISA